MTLMNGYNMVTTFPMDFTIADAFGASAIRDTYERAFDSWKTDPTFLAELAVTLNYKIWEWYGKNNDYADLYNSLWIKTDEYAYENLDAEGVRIYFNITD